MQVAVLCALRNKLCRFSTSKALPRTIFAASFSGVVALALLGAQHTANCASAAATALAAQANIAQIAAARRLDTAFTALADFHTDMTASPLHLPVQTVFQYPELLNGCEITSATTVLRYLGFSADKLTMADTYLPLGTPYQQTDPNEAFMGDPHDVGWYCYAGPVVQAVNDYLADADPHAELHATDITGASSLELIDSVRSGSPVIFWATIGFRPPQYAASFTTPSGEAVYTNLHCMVLTGCSADTLYISDPLGVVSSVSRDLFTEIYEQTGRRAVVLESSAGK